MHNGKVLAVVLSASFATACGHFNSTEVADESDPWASPAPAVEREALSDAQEAHYQTRPALEAASQGQPKSLAMHDALTRQERNYAMQQRMAVQGADQQRKHAMAEIAWVQPPPISSGSREGYDPVIENRFKQVALSPLSTFGLDVDTASYSNVRRWINQGTLPPAAAVRAEEIVNYFDYGYPESNGEHPVNVVTELGHCPWNPDHRLAVVGVSADQLDKAEAPANRLTFLIDTSGSMHAANKLPLLKRSFAMLIDQLRPQDQVAIVAYAGSAGLVLPPTSAANKTEIMAALNRLRSGGSTAGGAGIQLAYNTAMQQFAAGANNRVLIATDGDFNVGQSSDGELVKMIEQRRDQGVFLTVMGFGQGNYQDAKMQKLADHGNGVHYYIDSDLEANRIFTDKLTSTLVTVAKDAKIQIEWNPERVAGYRLVGYENRMLASEDFTDDKKDAGDLGAGHTVTAIYEIIPRGKNDEIPESDLRYQRASGITANASEIGWLKLRYKEPLASRSKLIEQAIQIPSNWKPHAPSANFQWAVSAAEFAMLLRQSEHQGNASWQGLQTRLAEIPEAHRSTPIHREFIRLVRASAQLFQHDVAHWSPRD